MGARGACVIGVTAAIEPARWGAWDQLADLAPRGYALNVQKAGGVAVVLPADEAVAGDPDRLLDRLDGLILAGGADLDPATYGQDAAPTTIGHRPDRDAFEVALAAAALERDLPLLGICRGFQIINVAAGGTLEQHLPDVVGHERHRSIPGRFDEHEVDLVQGSRVATFWGAERIMVKSHHHQGLARMGDGLAVTGYAVPDLIAEAIEVPDRSFALGVQWHPEEDADDPLIAALVEAARAKMGS